MCGIIGYVGKKKCLNILINGIKALEYRGYDSVGLAYYYKNKINIVKDIGRISELEKNIDIDIDTNIGIGHTRWATHGKPNKVNAHPHKQGKITLVHNGIIENYIELKEELIKIGYKFNGDTDTEVASAYIDYLYTKHNDINTCLEKIKEIFIGSYALCVLCDDFIDTIFITKKGSPMLLGINDNEKIIASDISAIVGLTKKYIILDDNDIGIIKDNEYTIYNNFKKATKEILSFDKDIEKISKEGYPHYMLKEIHEQNTLLKNTIDYYINNNLLNTLPDISKYKNICIIACGSAYHAGLVGKYYIEKHLNIPVNVELASEFRYKKLFINKDTLVIAISQSGETADTIEAVKIAKEHKCHTLGIVNTYKSTIARICDEVIYINAGIEVAVATTKAYSLQVLYLLLLSIKNKKIDIDEINKVYDIVTQTLNNSFENIAKKFKNYEHTFFIGRSVDYYLSLEGSLKLKEISYIHAESYAAGELKHGTISLIDTNTPVIGIITDKKIASKTISNIKEVLARGAYVILICSDDIEIDNNAYHEIYRIPNNKYFKEILAIINMQLLAYYVAKIKNCNIDKPKNLAKSVTVE